MMWGFVGDRDMLGLETKEEDQEDQEELLPLPPSYSRRRH